MHDGAPVTPADSTAGVKVSARFGVLRGRDWVSAVVVSTAFVTVNVPA